jgi:oligopeptide/dipeptide ABC transporter ATP-binding protein
MTPATSASTSTDPVLELRDLVQHFPGAHNAPVRAVDGISLTVGRGETVGVVGESGSGKTTVGRAALRLYKPTSGTIMFEGKDVTHENSRQLAKDLRRRSAMIFQNPTTSLNPYMRLIDVLMEPLEIQRIGNHSSRHRAAEAMLEQVGLDPRWGARYPRELSGGQRQRVGVGRALMLEPSLVVADEPTAALDVSVQAQVINLMADLQAERGLGYLFISHDLSLVKHISHRVAVMYLGRIVEMGTAEEIFEDPRHPYTVSLASMKLEPGKKIVPQGEVPSPSRPPSGCHFHTRCPIAKPICAQVDPVVTTGATGRTVACHFPGELGLPSDGRVMLDIAHPLASARPVATAPASAPAPTASANV